MSPTGMSPAPLRTRGRTRIAALSAVAVALPLTLAAAGAGPAGATPLPTATACPIFPAGDVWHANVSRLPVNARSAQWTASMNASSTRLHPDFGPSYNAQPVPYGIPVTTVTNSHPTAPVRFTYSSESDHVFYPLGSDSKVEGGQNASGDRHVIIVNRDTCLLFELWDTHYQPGASWAGSGARWNLRSDALRPAGWTSGDAAGLPILPGLLRYDEVAAGHIDHAIRFTAAHTDRLFIWPARHQAGSASNHALPPMGARFRLKASYVVSSSLRADTRAVLAAFKAYGLILADNGSNWYFQGTQDTGWPSALLDQLKAVPASAFEAVDESSLMADPNSGRVKTP